MKKSILILLLTLLQTLLWAQSDHLNITATSLNFGTQALDGNYELSIDLSSKDGKVANIGVVAQLTGLSLPDISMICPPPNYQPFTIQKSGGNLQGNITSQTSNRISVYFNPTQYDFSIGKYCNESQTATGYGNYSVTLVINYSGSQQGFPQGVLGSFHIPISAIVAEAVVHIPDANFKNYLVGNANINTNGDEEIQFSEAVAFTGTISCSEMNIASLTGIEAFVNITGLNCYNNNLTSLNISANTKIKDLLCDGNDLTALNLSNNNAITYLNCGDNKLPTLNISNLSDLEVLYCHTNQLTALDLSNNTALTFLSCYSNRLLSLDLSNNTALNTINCSGNSITSLDVSNNSALTSLQCQHNSLLNALNVANGNNTNFTSFLAMGTAVTCIQVDDSAWSAVNWTSIPDGAIFSENPCTQAVTPCNISNVDILTTSNCTQDNLEYSQTLQINYDNAPSGTIDVNGQSFAVTSSPQTVTLTGLIAHGNAVDLYITIDTDENCDYTLYEAWFAPRVCDPLSTTDLKTHTIKAYPNPVHDMLNIEFEEPTFVEIYSASGVIVLRLNPALEHRIDISNLPDGLYFIRSENGAGKSFVKE